MHTVCLIGVLLAGAASALQDQDDYNKKLSLIMERLDRIVDDAAVDLLKTGKVEETRQKIARILFNRLTYAFKVTIQEYIDGKRAVYTDEMERAEKLLKDIAASKNVQGGWLEKAAHQRLLPKIRRAIADVPLAEPWAPCDGSEQGCATCQVVRAGNP